MRGRTFSAASIMVIAFLVLILALVTAGARASPGPLHPGAAPVGVEPTPTPIRVFSLKGLSPEPPAERPSAPQMPSGKGDAASAADIAGGPEAASPPGPQAAVPTFTSPGAVLWDNGPLVTHPAACAGQDASRLQTSLSMSTLGFGHQFSLGYRMADQFTVTNPAGWQVDQITFFAYQTNAPISPSPITGVYYQIWDGPPNEPSSSVVFGDLTTNRLLSSTFSNIQRDMETSPCANNRYIFANVASAGVTLPPGTYWLDWMTDGSAASGPWAPPITILGETSTGDALQYTTAWAPALDSGTGTQQGMPFLVEGTQQGTLLLDQQPNQTNGFFSDESCDVCGGGQQVLAENFALATHQTIMQIVLWGGYHPTDTPIDPDDLTVIFHQDAGGLPGPVVATESPAAYERVQTGVILFGVHEWKHALTLATPVALAPGNYWVEIYNDTGWGTDDYFWETGNPDTIGNGLPDAAVAFEAPGSSWSYPAGTELAMQLIGPSYIYLPLILKNY